MDVKKSQEPNTRLTLNERKADFCQSTSNKHKCRISTNVMFSHCVLPRSTSVHVSLASHFVHSSDQLFRSGKVSNTRFYVVVCVKCFVGRRHSSTEHYGACCMGCIACKCNCYQSWKVSCAKFCVCATAEQSEKWQYISKFVLMKFCTNKCLFT